ncbi:MAG: hypothetical protein KDB21_11655 [Acidimicrobiales bacterium]|nr:hypothetical protein [Acidimicrobiales bacterium]
MAQDNFVLAVDLDGVCADHTRAFRSVVAVEWGVSEDSLTLERSWDFVEWGMDDTEFERLHRLAVVEYRMFAAMDPIDGVAESLWRLSDAGIWIRIVTHRLYVNWGHAAAAGDTAQWLDDARIPYRDLCFLGAKSDVGADAYVEDGPHNIAALQRAGREVVVFDQPYNRDLPGRRARSWPEVEEHVLELAAARADGVQPQLPGVDAGADRLDRRLGRG